MNWLLLFLLVISPFLLTAKTIIVSANSQVRTLKIALSQAAPGDTIVVKTGTYREGNVIITTPVVILGEGYPVFDGEEKYEIFTINADHVTISGLKFVNTGTASMNDIAAVKVYDSKYVTIRDNEFVDAFFHRR